MSASTPSAPAAPAPPSAAAARAELLRVDGVGKSFPGVRALHDVSLRIAEGEVLGLLGENGAGKSTLLKILSGAQHADAGAITYRGAPLQVSSPQDAQAAGIVTIYQEFNLIPDLSIAENVYIGREPGGALFINWRQMREDCAGVLARLGLSLTPTTRVRDLSIAEQQLVEIAKALSTEARLIIMDEPTAALTAAETERLFAIIGDLKARGVAVIFVTHRLDEAMAICDRFTVLRDGALVGHRDAADTGVDDIIRMMVGRDVAQHFTPAAPREQGAAALSVRGLSSADDDGPAASSVRLEDVSLDLHRGEILGLAGLMGAGRTELARAIFGADPFGAGDILLEGRSVRFASPAEAIRNGVGLAPEDRKQQALFLDLAVRQNLTIAALKDVSRNGPLLGAFVDRAAEDTLIERFRKALNIRMSSPEQTVSKLSGGNQQKVVLARWLALEPKVLIVDEPTRGVDVGAKGEVHQHLDAMARAGIAILAISSDLPELLAISDRIATMCEGRLTGVVSRGEATEERLMRMMTDKRARGGGADAREA